MPPLPTLAARNTPGIPMWLAEAAARGGGEALAPEPVGDVRHVVIDGAAEPLLARLCVPEGEGPFPVLVYFHGDGFVIANLDTYDVSARALANAGQSIVVSVAYRQAPENMFPAAAEDAYAAYTWVRPMPASSAVTRAGLLSAGRAPAGTSPRSCRSWPVTATSRCRPISC